jgi:lauroyl/myristoyl acyltransferase
MDAYLAFRAVGAIAPRIPARWGYAVAGWLADLVHARNIQAVRGLRDNIRHAVGPSASPNEIEGATRRAYRVLLQNYFDLFRLPGLTLEQLCSFVSIVGWENVKVARALGRGLVLLTAHLGNPEAGLQIVGTTDVPVMGPAEHVQPERLYRDLVNLRTRHGLRLIPSDGPLLELFRVLRRNGAVGLALDRDTTNSGAQVMLCGAPARVPDGYAHIAAKLRVPLVPAFCYCLPGHRTQLDIWPMFLPDETADRDEVYRAALDFGVRELERAITTHPEQWVLTTPIWIVNC